MKMVKVRIAVAVDPNGRWNASGWLGRNNKPADESAKDIAIEGVDEGGEVLWVEADVPIPESQVIKGSVG